MKKMNEATEERIRLAYMNGMIEGIKLYAWWKNGTQYVGSGITTLKEVIEDVKKEYREKQMKVNIFELLLKPDYNDIDKKF